VAMVCLASSVISSPSNSNLSEAAEMAHSTMEALLLASAVTIAATAPVTIFVASSSVYSSNIS